MRIALSGTLDAIAGDIAGPRAGIRRELRAARALEAADLELADVQPFVTAAGGPNLPLTGAFNAHITADGPLHAPTAPAPCKWSAARSTASRSQAARPGRARRPVLKLTSATLNVAGGNISASGSYDFESPVQPGHFQIDARAENIDIARVDFVRSRNVDATGKLAFSITGSGTFERSATFARRATQR